MKILIAIFMGLVLTSCAGQFSNPLIYGNPFDLTVDQVEELLEDRTVIQVSQTMLQASCPQAAANYSQFNMNLADCVDTQRNIVRFREDLTDGELDKARRHVASHFYDIEVRGSSQEDSSKHLNWYH